MKKNNPDQSEQEEKPNDQERNQSTKKPLTNKKQSLASVGKKTSQQVDTQKKSISPEKQELQVVVQDSSSDDGDNQPINEIAPNDDQAEAELEGEEDAQDADQENDSDRPEKENEHLLQEVSEQGSELFETDSSCGEEDVENVEKTSLHSDKLLAPEEQGKDIVAGSPTKVSKEQEVEEEQKETGRFEMNGVIVYDSYAKLTGCEKIVNYFEGRVLPKLNPYILFSKEEVKEATRDVFGDKARERDFSCEYDKLVFRNLPRFQTQRDFSKPQFEIFVPQQQNVLIFDSRFENGNLRKVAKVNNIEYNLWLENDLNTKGHTQWYYFKVVYKDIAVRAEKKTHKIKFNFLNLAKTTSLYQDGMLPCVWSKKKNEQDGTGWFKGGGDITYLQNDITRQELNVEGQPMKKMQQNENNNNAFLYNNNGLGEGVDTYFTFSFTYEFEANQDDEVWFAHAVPSTYTQMQNDLVKLRNDEQYKDILKFNIMSLSLARNPSPLMTITENISTYLDYYEELRLLYQIPNIVKKAYRQKYNNAKRLAKQSENSKGRVQRLLQAALEEEIKQFYEYNEDNLLQTSPKFAGFGSRLTQFVKDHGQKKAIVITSRVHPGEPQASHMLDGLIQYLLSKEAAQIRKHFVVRIVPMLNPDGVIYGNYRCSLLGCDLNRKWEKPNRLLHPTVFYSKQLVRHMHQERKVVLYCDLHGHSRKQNAFFYGCCFKNYEQEGRVKNAQLRLIPLMCCQKNDLFKLKDCRFRIEKCKESTARVVVFREFNIVNSFTLECSFFGKEIEPGQKVEGQTGIFANMTAKKKRILHMSVPDYQSLGSTLMSTINNYLPSEQYKLQFLSGKILDVFYDEFIKFVPPYILKREEEKRKKLEENNQQPAQKGTQRNQNSKQDQIVSSGQKMTRKSTMNMNTNQTTTKGSVPPALQGLRTIIGGTLGTVPYQELVASNASLSNQPYVQLEDTDKADLGAGDESSDHKATFVVSGNDSDNYSLPLEQQPLKNKEDLAEFETFMNGIQDKMRKKEEARQARRKAGGDPNGAQFDSDAYSSDASSGDDTYKPKKQKTKKKKKTQQIANKIPGMDKSNQKKKIQQTNEKEPVKQSDKDKQALKTNKMSRFDKKARSPRQIESVGGISRRHTQAIKNEPMTFSSIVNQQQQPVSVNTQQIQNLIWNQLSMGVLNQSEILNEISRAIIHNQAQQSLASDQMFSLDQFQKGQVQQNNQTMIDPKSRGNQMLIQSVQQRGISDFRTGNQLNDMIRGGTHTHHTNYIQDEQQRMAQVNYGNNAGMRNIANAIYENALASVSSVQQENRGSKLGTYQNLTEKEQYKYSTYQGTSGNQSVGPGGLPQINTNPGSKMSNNYPVTHMQSPQSAQWGQKKQQLGYSPGGLLSGGFGQQKQKTSLHVPQVQNGLEKSSPITGRTKQLEDARDFQNGQSFIRIEGEKRMDPSITGSTSYVPMNVQQMNGNNLNHPLLQQNSLYDNREETKSSLLFDDQQVNKPQKLRRDFIISRTGSTAKKSGIVRQSNTFDDDTEETRARDKHEDIIMDESGGHQIRSTGSRGLPSASNLERVQKTQNLILNLQEKPHIGDNKNSIDYKKDVKRSSLLQQIPKHRKIKPVLGQKSYDNQSQNQVQKLSSSNNVDSQTMFGTQSSNRQPVVQNIQVQIKGNKLQHFQNKRGILLAEQSESSMVVNSSEKQGADSLQGNQYKTQSYGQPIQRENDLNSAPKPLIASESAVNNRIGMDRQAYSQGRHIQTNQQSLTADNNLMFGQNNFPPRGKDLQAADEYMPQQNVMTKTKPNGTYQDQRQDLLNISKNKDNRQNQQTYTTSSGLALRAGRRQVYHRSSIETGNPDIANTVSKNQYNTQPIKDKPKQSQHIGLAISSSQVNPLIQSKDYEGQLQKQDVQGSLDMVLKQKQLQIQLERQQQLLQQLQQQLQHHQTKQEQNQNEGQQIHMKNNNAQMDQNVQQISRDVITFMKQENQQKQMKQGEMVIPNVADNHIQQKPTKPFSNEIVSRQLYNNSDSVENLDAPRPGQMGNEYQVKQNMSERVPRNQQQEMQHGFQSYVNNNQIGFKIHPQQLGRPMDQAQNSGRLRVDDNQKKYHAPLTPNLTSHKVQNEQLLTQSIPEFFEQRQLQQQNGSRHLQPEQALSPDLRKKYERRLGDVPYHNNNQQQFQQYGNQAYYDGLQIPREEGISVANYVQNINVFVTDANPNIQGNAAQTYGMGIGYGALGNLGRMSHGVADQKTVGEAQLLLPNNQSYNMRGASSQNQMLAHGIGGSQPKLKIGQAMVQDNEGPGQFSPDPNASKPSMAFSSAEYHFQGTPVQQQKVNKSMPARDQRRRPGPNNKGPQ